MDDNFPVLQNSFINPLNKKGPRMGVGIIAPFLKRRDNS